MITYMLLAAAEASEGSWFGKLVIPIVVILIALTFILVVRYMATRYKKIAPNQVGIFYGRKYTHRDAEGQKKTRGFRLVTGGGSLLWPVVEYLQIMSTAVTQVPIDERDIPNKDNVKISSKGVATFKIDTTEEALHNAANNFLGKSEEEMKVIVGNILQGHLRSIIGKMDINEILRDRDAFNKKVVEESTGELKQLGIQIITLVITEVEDEHGYIDALGKRVVAEAIRDANIKVAEAEAETVKKTSDAKREADITVAQNAVKVAEAERNRDVKRAEYKVTADQARAQADNALNIADAAQKQTLAVALADRDAAAAEAQTKVQTKQAERVEKELVATTIRPAEAARQKAVIEADAARQKAVIEAEAHKQVAVTMAEGNKAQAITTAEGAKQAAVLEGVGQASRTRATLLAEAEGKAAITKQALLAEADGQAAMKGRVLLAEAEGTEKLAEALRKLDERGKLILILDRAPGLIEKAGDALAKTGQSVFGSVAAPFGQIDSLRIVDLGGGGKGLQGLGNVVPQTVFNFIAGLEARGVDVNNLLKKLGIDLSKVKDMLGTDEGAAGGGERKA